MYNSNTKPLIVWHSRTGTAKALAEAAFEGTEGRAIIKCAANVEAQDLLSAAAYLFVCPENLAAISGKMKEMFDRTYYPVLGKIEGRAYATMIAAGSDGENAQKQIDRIATGWRLKRVADPFILNTEAQTPEEILARKTVPAEAIRHAHQMGAALAEGCAMGVF